MAYNAALKPANIVSDFRKTGIYPSEGINAINPSVFSTALIFSQKKYIRSQGKEQQVKVITSNVGPEVENEISCLAPAVREDPEQLLRAILSAFGESRSPATLLQMLFTH